RLLHISVNSRGLFPTQEATRFEVFRSTQVAKLKGRRTLNAALGQPKVAKAEVVTRQTDPLAWLERELTVSQGGGPEILKVSLSGPEEDIPELQLVINAVADEFLKREDAVERQKLELQQEQLRALAEKFKAKLNGFRQGLKRQPELGGSPELLALQRQLATK